MLLASPIALVALPTQKRLALASELEAYFVRARPAGRRPPPRRQHVAREKHGGIALATFLVVLLLAALGAAVSLLHRGGLADYVLEVARAGGRTAAFLAGLL